MLRIFLQAQFVVICLVSGLFAQLPRASEFLPLQIGNVWQHQRADGFGVAVQSEVVSDTLLGDTLIVYKLRFHAFQETPPVEDWFGYRNYNHDSTAVYDHEEFPLDPLNPFNKGFTLLDTQSGLGGRWEVFLGDHYATAAITDTSTVSVFGERRKQVEVNLIEEVEDTIKVVEGFHLKFVDRIGISRVGFDRLIYAKIDGREFGTPITSVRGREAHDPISNPDNFRLQIFPNPARTEIAFFLTEVSEGPTEVTIYDILGRRLRSFKFVGSNRKTRKVNWNGRDARNQVVASGIYFVTVRAGHLFRTHKFIYLR